MLKEAFDNHNYRSSISFTRSHVCLSFLNSIFTVLLALVWLFFVLILQKNFAATHFTFKNMPSTLKVIGIKLFRMPSTLKVLGISVMQMSSFHKTFRSCYEMTFLQPQSDQLEKTTYE